MFLNDEKTEDNGDLFVRFRTRRKIQISGGIRPEKKGSEYVPPSSTAAGAAGRDHRSCCRSLLEFVDLQIGAREELAGFSYRSPELQIYSRSPDLFVRSEEETGAARYRRSSPELQRRSLENFDGRFA
ncbi:hypothetical protein LIER_20859 [Lithospermum erythrorhizon]|uniref:Uncharacterized protein n=1 Tax=Lithospermum erythrorhizon TaxID=34254 RepID=A0AAV3QN29_LITER